MKLARFAWSVLAYNLAVILWGAYVRATGSGAGCGAHWPLCNGEVIPRAPSAEMLIEFSHRITSGLALVAVVGLVVAVFRSRPVDHPSRRAAAWALGFMLTEAAVGAALVLFRLVADNASMARALFMAVHLANTFVLLACLTLTAHFLSDGASLRLAGRAGRVAALAAGFLGLFAAGVSGAIAALGDTLFPARSIAEALSADLSPTSHVLIRLRVLHPAIAVVVGLALAAAAQRFPLPPGDRRGRLATRLVAALALTQIAAGFVNVVLLAPVWMQLVHLLLADLLFIAFVVLAASTLADDASSRVDRLRGGA
jgi:cytochrome c oxidase assembly protein subunit 15